MSKDAVVRLFKEKVEDVTLARAKELVDVVLETFEQILQEEGELKISGFGKFSVVHKEERKAKNPRTGEEVVVPPKNVIKFKSAQALKDLVNQ